MNTWPSAWVVTLTGRRWLEETLLCCTGMSSCRTSKISTWPLTSLWVNQLPRYISGSNYRMNVSLLDLMPTHIRRGSHSMVLSQALTVVILFLDLCLETLEKWDLSEPLYLTIPKFKLSLASSISLKSFLRCHQFISIFQFQSNFFRFIDSICVFALLLYFCCSLLDQLISGSGGPVKCTILSSLPFYQLCCIITAIILYYRCNYSN